MKRFAALLVACMLTIQVAGCNSGGTAPVAGSDGEDHTPGEGKAYQAREAAGKVGFNSDAAKNKPQTAKSKAP
jgi:hypothetical protein